MKFKYSIAFSITLTFVMLLAGCTNSNAYDYAPPEPFDSDLPYHTIQSEPVPSQAAPTPAATPFPEITPVPETTATPCVEIDGQEYFDEALFVGDSIMEGIRQYVVAKRQDGEALGTAKFLTSTMGISLEGLLGEQEINVQFNYQGRECPLEDILTDIAPHRVFLLLGLNDLSSDPDVIVADCVDRYTRLIERLQISCPQIEFIIITPPPKVASSWLPDYTANRSFNNQLIGKYVEALIEMCVQEDIPYIDAYTALKDENNALPDNFCRDGFIHLNHQGAAVVVEAVESFAQGDKT
jgi:lysophospholipase L1-like esterase